MPRGPSHGRLKGKGRSEGREGGREGRLAYDQRTRMRACGQLLVRSLKLYCYIAAIVTNADLGWQLSLFFSDPDGNMLELTTWVDRADPRPSTFPKESPAVWRIHGPAQNHER